MKVLSISERGKPGNKGLSGGLFGVLATKLRRFFRLRANLPTFSAQNLFRLLHMKNCNSYFEGSLGFMLQPLNDSSES
jgi:hypothetical protein